MVIHLCHVCVHMAGYDYGTGMATIDNGRTMRKRLLLVSRANFLFIDSACLYAFRCVCADVCAALCAFEADLVFFPSLIVVIF